MTRAKEVLRDSEGRIKYVVDVELPEPALNRKSALETTDPRPTMTTMATKYIRTTAKAPTSRGTFEGLIDFNPPEGDKDGERIASFRNVPGKFPLLYQHAYGDPGAEIGDLKAMSKGDARHLLVLGKLDLQNPMAVGVHERMLLSSKDPAALSELSVGFDYDTSKVFKDENGVTVIPDANLLEVSVVYKGAQTTSVRNVKASIPRKPDPNIARLNKLLDNLTPKPTRKSGTPDVDEFLRAEALRRDTITSRDEQKRIRAQVIALVDEVRQFSDAKGG